MAAPTLPQTLKGLRNSRNMTAKQVAEALHERMGGDLRTEESIYVIESRGIRDHSLMVAYASIFDIPIEDMAAIASPPQKI